MARNPEAYLNISNIIAEVMLQVVDTGDGSDDALHEARLSAENASESIMNYLFIDIAESPDANGNFVALIKSIGVMGRIGETE
jgi:hypothetical protein